MQVSIQRQGELADALHRAGFRATDGRVALLEELRKASEPLSANKLAARLRGKLDLTNAYRSLEAFVEKGLVRRVDVGHQHMHYELGSLAAHHHHYVCVDCGAREGTHA